MVWEEKIIIIKRGMEKVRKFKEWEGKDVWIMMMIMDIYMVVKEGKLYFGREIKRDVIIEKKKDEGVKGEKGYFEEIEEVEEKWIKYLEEIYMKLCEF